ncbi:LysR family transcriptional regulator [Adhaeribacter pallidiroseus]|uniref:HTH-type transcriptional regulator AlsR n=1 Tax=Adhaeribacter pallidiroseus TaxID=2072847 RepID=A0A369QNX5_9BACT|nr:LysR substrate-binding domain-containing protein [Adhaeribacter pallidiroseus]RDC64976.1 HTH-type transcriptional regulator AlsR [Adhaeribacter pallidiroseus]
MELRHLLYFKTVAEELHFRKAANKLFISQPPLSRQIKELEDELGAILFTRSNKQVSLTPAGKFFKKEIDTLFSHLAESKNVVKQMHGAIPTPLRIGYISSTYQQHLVPILKELPAFFPFAKTRLYEVPTVKQVRALEEGKLDVGIMRAPVQSEKLKIITLFPDPFVVVLPAQEQNFSGTESLAEFLKNQPFIFFNQNYAPDYYRKLVEICQRLGFVPEVAHEPNNIHSILRLVESGMGVSIVPASVQEQYPYLKLSYYGLPGIPITTEVVLAYKPSASNAVVDWFIQKFTAKFNTENPVGQPN